MAGRLLYFLPIFFSLLHKIAGGSQITNTNGGTIRAHDEVHKLEYKNYLMEVIELVETDEEFHEKLRKDVMDLEFEKAAKHLNTLKSELRTRLDEIKRMELNRIRTIAEELEKRGHKERNIRHHIQRVSDHVDVHNLHTFGTEDLRRLLTQSHIELQELDRIRHEKFKVYEMHKRLEFEELLKRVTPNPDKPVMEEELQKLFKQHKKRKPIHMPMSKQHLMEVWEEHDKMDRENFNMKTFFHMHDLDGNGFYDETELKTLLNHELNRNYDPTTTILDKNEREEELERMREFAFSEMDANKDHIITLEEFIENNKKRNYHDDHFWETLGNSPTYSDDEYETYSMKHKAEINRMIDTGQITLPPSGVVMHHDNPENASIVQGTNEEKLTYNTVTVE